MPETGLSNRIAKLIKCLKMANNFNKKFSKNFFWKTFSPMQKHKTQTISKLKKFLENFKKISLSRNKKLFFAGLAALASLENLDRLARLFPFSLPRAWPDYFLRSQRITPPFTSCAKRIKSLFLYEFRTVPGEGKIQFRVVLVFEFDFLAVAWQLYVVLMEIYGASQQFFRNNRAP